MAEILANEDLEMKIESFSLIPSDSGRFEFSVNGENIFSKKSLGRHPEEKEVYNLLINHIR
jgi:selT/selW/selH-like putative selenoprotein